MDLIVLIDTGSVKKLVPEIPKNFDDDLLLRHIIQVQHMIVRPLIGFDLFNLLIDEIRDEEIKEENKFILTEYISRIMSFEVFRRILIYNNVSVDMSGVRIKDSDYSQGADHKSIIMTVRAVEDDIDFWKRELVEYLKKNRILYPAYKCSSIDRKKHVTNTGMNISII